MVTEGLVTVGGPVAVTGGGPPFPGERPLGRPVAPKEESRGALGGGLLLLLLANGCMVPLPGDRHKQIRLNNCQHNSQSVHQMAGGTKGRRLALCRLIKRDWHLDKEGTIGDSMKKLN